MYYCVDVFCHERPDDKRLQLSFAFDNENERSAFILCLDKRMRVSRQYSRDISTARDAAREVFEELNEAFD